MEGFFTKKETASKTRPDSKSYSCAACGLYRDCKNPRIKPYGNFKKKILNIGEAPGEYEDLKGKPWQGKTGRLLKQTYEKLGIDLFNDCLNINAVLCRPTTKDGENRAPTNYEAECCRKSILKLINEYKPKVIVLFGNTAVFSLIGHRWKKDLGGIMKWRGWQIPDQDFNAWICPTFHPSYVHRAKSNPYNYDGRTAEETIWVQDLREAILCLKTPFPVYQEPIIKIIKNLSFLD
jgi:DNA polymerase